MDTERENGRKQILMFSLRFLDPNSFGTKQKGMALLMLELLDLFEPKT